MSDRLDDLLGTPLTEPTDAGFSAKVIARVLATEERASFWEWTGYGIAAAALLAAIPLAPIGEYVQRETPAIVNSAPMMMLAAVLVLTALLCRFAVRE
jgi:hypothetical protein